MLFLKIENPGVADPNNFILFGASSKKNCTHPRIIGKFGSGNEHGMLTCLRHELNPSVFCGTLKMNWYTEPIQIKGVDSRIREHLQVCVKYAGKDQYGKSRSGTQKLDRTLDCGIHDWVSVDMALREFVSNAIDACYEQGKDHRYVTIRMVDQSDVRACKDSTQVFIPAVPAVQRFYNNIHKWFLHFSESHLLDQKVLEKNSRNLPREDNEEPVARACLYRRGVLVGELKEYGKSLFDYNLDNFKIAESRTINPHEAKYVIGRALSGASADQLARVILAMSKGEEVFEATLDGYCLEPSWQDDEETKAVKKENWKKAVEAVGGSNAVLVGSGVAALSEMVTHKGFTPVRINNESWSKAAQAWNIRTETNVLTEDDLEGIRYSDPTQDVYWALNWVWDVLVDEGLLNGKKMPEVECFYKGVEAGSQTWGMYKDGTCFIHEEISNGRSDKLLVCMMEEVVHHITGATDFSRDFQTYLVRLSVALAKKLEAKS